MVLQSRCLGKEKREKLLIKVLRGYFKLTLLSTIYNQSMGQLFLSRFKSTTAISCIASAFVLVKLFILNDVVITSFAICAVIVFTGTFSLLTKFCSKVHQDSTELRDYLLSQKMSGKVVNKELKCFRVASVKIGSFFVVKRGTPLTMLAMISNVTMSMLISINVPLWKY